MTDRISELILNESVWLPLAMLIAALASTPWVRRWHREGRLDRQAVLGAMNGFYGCMIGVMGVGHLLAVTVAGLQDTRRGSPWFLYPLGFAIAVPAWSLCLVAARVVNGEAQRGRAMVWLNVWLGIALIALGLVNSPLAAPAALNLAYQFHQRRAVGWAILTVAVVEYLALLVGGLLFLASGQTFEQFSGG